MKKKFAFVIALNLLIVGGEMVFGLLGNSMGLIADALHNFSDVMALLVAYLAIVYAEKKASEKMTYGYIRSEMMAGFINSLFLMAAMAFVMIESVKKIINPPDVEGVYMMIVAGIALAANGLSVLILKGSGLGHAHHHAHEDKHGHKHEHEHENINVKAAVLHLISDVAISFAVVLGGLIIFIGKGKYQWVRFVDPGISIVFAVFIFYQAFKILRRSFFSLMDRNEKDIDKFAEDIVKIEGVDSVHGMHINAPSSKDIYFSSHIVVNDELTMKEAECILEKVRDYLATQGVTHSVLQPETSKYKRDDKLCIKHSRD